MTPGFTCRHVHAGAPVLRAVRDEPLDSNDSGWALVCGGYDHVDEDYMIVDLDRYVSQDESLVTVMELPPNTVACRAQEHQPWVVEALGIQPEMSN